MNQPLDIIRPEDFRQIREIFESALTYPAADRVHFVERACSGDARLVSEVQGMLEADAMTILSWTEKLRGGGACRRESAMRITLRLRGSWAAAAWEKFILAETRI